jgi:hypothetical protein
VTVGKGLNTYLYEAYVYRSVNGATLPGTEALIVNLTCSATAVCKVPATVSIPAGQYYAYFQVEGVGIGNTTITVSAAGHSATQDLAVNVIPPKLNFSGPGTTKVGATTAFTVYLTTPGANYSGNETAIAPITVNITSSDPAVAQVPTTVTINAGTNTSVSANMTGFSAGTTTLTASGSSLTSVTTGVITINP